MSHNYTPLLPNFPCRFGRPRKSATSRAKERLVKEGMHQLPELRQLFSSYLDLSALRTTSEDGRSRQRIFTKELTFWALIFQTLAGLGCRGAVKRVQSWMINQGRALPSSNPSAYSQAKARLSLEMLEKVFESTAAALSTRIRKQDLWCGRRVKVVDGTGLTASDTPENQEAWPQNGNAKPGCGFPQLMAVGIFCLHNGALLAWKEGNKHDSEIGLWRKLWQFLCPGDVVLGDRGFGSYADVAMLAEQGVDGVYRLKNNRKLDWAKGRCLGTNDRIFTWHKPRRRTTGLTKEQWDSLPAQIEVRVVRLSHGVPGFRTEKINVVTTLLDPKAFPAEQLLELYRRRWAVELFFRDVKTTMGMDQLRSQTPTAVRKEICTYLVCYNLIRGLMTDACLQYQVPIRSVSFKGTVEQLSHWLWLFMDPNLGIVERRKRLKEFYAALISAPLPNRPNRIEPRVRKGRPKNYRLMTRPRRPTPAKPTFTALS